MKTDHAVRWWIGAVSASVLLALGCASWGVGRDGLLLPWSYDLLVPWVPKPAITEKDAIILCMEDGCIAEGEPGARRQFAPVLDRLTADQARVVVMDFYFATNSAWPDEDVELARAMRANGRVFVPADVGSDPHLGKAEMKWPIPAFPLLSEAAKGWGSIRTNMERGKDEVTRRYVDEGIPRLPWLVAEAAGADAKLLQESVESCWLNYYGPAGSIPRLSFTQATNQLAGYFSNRVVFIGRGNEERDVHRTPYTRWTGTKMPGVELVATGTLNLVRAEWWREADLGLEFLVSLVGAVGFGCTVSQRRAGLVWVVGISAAGGILLVAVVLAGAYQVFFCWLGVVGLQWPAAVVMTRLVARRWPRRSEVARGAGRTAETASDAKVAGSGEGRTVLAVGDPEVPDHTLLRCVGRGSYGEVWLARNAVGLFHAVKIVFRGAFADEKPYLREFHGIQTFMPISRDHPHVVQVLHVGRNDGRGYFYCVMEVADDVEHGRAVEPEVYVPLHLARRLADQPRMSVIECVDLGVGITAALGYLHAHRLVHRDIKPSNIIYVKGVPKVADIGLVTTVGSAGRATTYLGTEGYIPPEGPGTPAADIYALGKVLYEASTGLDRGQFPDLPTTFVAQPAPDFVELNRIILKACAADVALRYSAASQFHAALLALQRQIKASPQDR